MRAPGRSIRLCRGQPRVDSRLPCEDSASCFFLQLGLQLFEQIQRLQRRERVHIHSLDAIDNSLRKRCKDRELHWLVGCFHLYTLPFLFFVLPQYMSCAIDHRRGKTSQSSHLNAVALARGPWFNGVQKHNASLGFFHTDTQISNSLEFLRQHCELVVVRSEKRASARLCLQILYRCPRKR